MKIIVGMSGATGAIYGIRLLEALGEASVETHLIMSKWAETTTLLETNHSLEYVKKLATYVHAPTNQAAIISSGSFITDAMVVIPCSMKSIASISHGLADNLLTRAADVILKENRKLILVPRETPLNQIHLENMLKLAKMGVSISPPMPAFYNKPESIDDIVNHSVARVLDQLGIENKLTKRWLQNS